MNCIFEDPAYSGLKNNLIASTGLAFYQERDKPLIDLIGGRLSDLGLRDCSAYAEFLADSEAGGAEMEFLIAQLTIGETYFFRDEAQFAAIRNIVLPDILRRNRTSRQIRIWSAGCATGAEPYSLAILLAREFAARIAGWRVDIYATDLNRSFLAQAAEGRFRAWALRSTSDEVKRECFSNEGLIWAIHPLYKQWISFGQMNLVEDDFSAQLTVGTYFDLILCRNVMIYFAPEVTRRLIGQFHRSLGEEGWLVVGAAEHNLENYKMFCNVSAPGARLYQKSTLSSGRPSHERLDVSTLPLAAPPLPVAPPAPVAPSAKPPTEPDRADTEGLRQLADRGDWQRAAEYGQRLLAQDRLNPKIHFYQALIFENLGVADQSQRSLRQAIYLDRTFAMAHFHLGLALQRDRKLLAAARSFGNALQALAGMPDDAIVTAGPGVTVTELRELARMHRERPGRL